MEDFDRFIHGLNESVGEISIWLLAQLVTFPYILVISAAVVIYLVSSLTQKRFQSEQLGIYNLIFFALAAYLTYLLFGGNGFIDSINQFLRAFVEVCKINYGGWCDYIPRDITKSNIILLTFTLFLISINSRIMWIVSIVVFEIYFVTGESEYFYQFFNSVPENKEYLFKGTIPFILAAPVVFIMWIFRENDRYIDILNKKNELKLKEKELNLRERELKIKTWEYELSREALKQ